MSKLQPLLFDDNEGDEDDDLWGDLDLEESRLNVYHETGGEVYFEVVAESRNFSLEAPVSGMDLVKLYTFLGECIKQNSSVDE